MRVAHLFLIVILVLAIGATLSMRHDVTAQTNGSRGVYIALGDSIAYGIGSSLPERRSYPVIVRDLLTASTGGSVSLVNLGVPGETAASFMTGGQLDAFIHEREVFDQAGIGVDVVSLTLGGNEMLAQRSGSSVERESALTEFQANLNEAVGRVRAAIGDETTLVLTTYYDLSEGDASLPDDRRLVDRTVQHGHPANGREHGRNSRRYERRLPGPDRGLYPLAIRRAPQ